MKEYQCSERQFLDDVKNHQLTIIKNDGVNRVLQFRNPKTRLGWFDLITWSGHLCIAGDYGSYVFSIREDMFKFFRNEKEVTKILDEFYINPQYWSEKLIAVDRTDGYEEYSADLFRENIKRQFGEWEFENKELRDKVWRDIEIMILSNSDDEEILAYKAALDYESDFGQRFVDFWEVSSKIYSFRFIWCLYAIVWGIVQFDKEIEQKELIIDN